jgi:type IV pilus assembly protein PilB
MGVEPYLIGAALNMVLAQRLVRRICAKCKQPYEPPRNIRKALDRMGYDITEFFRGVGCRSCRNTGFRGRIAIHELLMVDDAVRDAIMVDPTIGTIRELARHGGMITLRHDGFRKVREGMTTVDEVFHVVGDAKDSPRQPTPAPTPEAAGVADGAPATAI